MSSVLLAVLVAMVSVCHASSFFGFGYPNGAPRMKPRCPSTVKPCRIKVEMTSSLLGNQMIENDPCSCPNSKTCSNDWSDHDHVITRQLRTESSISMVLSMMFCDAIQPQRQCTAGEVALQVKGYSVVPTEVEFIQCTCPDARPLVLHERYHGADHRQYDSYVCSSYKPRCTVGWGNRQDCMTSDPDTHSQSYPCQCPSSHSCRANAYDGPFQCRRG